MDDYLASKTARFVFVVDLWCWDGEAIEPNVESPVMLVDRDGQVIRDGGPYLASIRQYYSRSRIISARGRHDQRLQDFCDQLKREDPVYDDDLASQFGNDGIFSAVIETRAVNAFLEDNMAKVAGQVQWWSFEELAENTLRAVVQRVFDHYAWSADVSLRLDRLFDFQDA